jgi:hypothetical protein
MGFVLIGLGSFLAFMVGRVIGTWWALILVVVAWAAVLAGVVAPLARVPDAASFWELHGALVLVPWLITCALGLSVPIRRAHPTSRRVAN